MRACSAIASTRPSVAGSVDRRSEALGDEHDVGQGRVDLVRDSRRELADRSQLIGVDGAAFPRALLREVDRDPEVVGSSPRLVPGRRDRQEHRTLPSLSVAVENLARPASTMRVGEVLPHPGVDLAGGALAADEARLPADALGAGYP